MRLWLNLNNKLTDRYYADIEVYTALEELGIRAHDIVPDVGALTIAPPTSEQAIAVAIPDAPLERTALISEHVNLRAVHIYLPLRHQKISYVNRSVLSI